MLRMPFGGAVLGLALALAALSSVHAGLPGGEVSFSNSAGKPHQKKKRKKRRQKFARRKSRR